jgi:hypothetical protein
MGTFGTSDNRASNGWMRNESEVMWKKWDMYYFKALFQCDLSDWESLTKFNPESQYLEQLNQALPQIQSEALLPNLKISSNLLDYAVTIS